MKGALLAGALLAPLAWLACGSDDGGPDASESAGPDAGATRPVPTADAGDALAPDTGDAGSPVTVTITDGLHRPASGASVVFYDPAGAVVTTGTTDATGQASATLPDGGAVTAVLGTRTAPRLSTVLGVKPGDALALFDETALPSPGARFAVTRPAEAPAGTQTITLVFGDCSLEVGSANPWTMDGAFGAGCYLGLPIVAPLVLFANGANGAPLAASVLTDPPLLDGEAAPVTFPAWTAVSGVKDSLTLVDPPASGAVGAGYDGVLTHFQGVGGAMGLATGRLFDPGELAGRSGLLHLPGATFQQDEIDLYETASAPSAFVLRATAIRQAPTASASLAFGAALPAITAATLTAGATPTIAFTAAAPLTAAKAVFVRAGWSTAEGDGAWTILAPPSATRVTPPPLPAALADRGPPADPGRFDVPPPFAAAVDGTSLATYDDARRLAGLFTVPSRLSRGITGIPVVPPLPAAGTLRLTAYGLRD